MAASGGRAALARAWHQGIRGKLSCFTKQSAAAMQTLRDNSGINSQSDQKSHLLGNPRSRNTVQLVCDAFVTFDSCGDASLGRFGCVWKTDSCDR